MAKAVQSMAEIPGIGRELAEKLVHAGFLNIEGILAAELSDLEAVAGFDAATAKTIFEAVAAQQKVEVEEPHESP